MYLVTIDNNLLHDPRIKDYQVLNPVLSLEINKAHSFNFTIRPNNPMFNSIDRLKSIIEVYDDGELIFRGRPLNDTADFNKATTIQCEGELAYLNDSTMEPYSYFGTVRGLLELYIDNHNAQVDASKQFTLGTVNVVGDFVRSNIDYTNTWEELSTKTFGSGMGGYLRLRRENNVNYIDYLTDSTYISGQTIELSKNLLDYEKTVKASDIVTVLIPLGAKLKDEEGNETDERLTIESVNAGSKFVEHTSGIAKYGRIVGYKIWDDINSPSLLKTRATNDLNFLVNLGISIKIKAIDLNVLDKSIPKIRFFEYVKIISKPHEIDDSMLIKKQTIHLDDPSQNTIEVGVEVSSFTDKQLEANSTIKKINADYITNDKLANVVNPLNIQISTILQESNLIKLSVERLSSKTDNLLFDSILTNANGELGSYQDWKDFASNDGIIFFDELKFLENMTFATLFEILKDNSVLGGEKLSFFGNGKQEYGLRSIVGGYEYSYRAKRVNGTQPRTVEINEYDSNQVYLRKRSFVFDGTDTYEDIPNLSFGSDVKFISITYIISGVSVSNRLEIAEAMFAIGDPKPYVKSTDSVADWAESMFEMQDNMIQSTVREVQIIDGRVVQNESNITQLSDEISLKVNADGVISAINLSPELVKILAKNIALEGYTSINDHFKVLPNGDVQMVNADVSGKITADSGKIAGFDISGENLLGNDVSLAPSKVTIGSTILENTSDNGGLGLNGQGITIAYGKTLPKNAFQLIRWGKPEGVGTFFATYNNQDTRLFAINRINISNISGESMIGSSENRLTSIYLQNQPNVSSDLRQKQAIQDIPKELIDEIIKVEPKMYLQHKTWHFGYIAQDIERALYKWATKKYGLNAKYYVDKFAMLHKDESHLSLLYGEIAVLKEKAMSDRIDKLEKELKEIKELLRKENVNGL